MTPTASTTAAWSPTRVYLLEARYEFLKLVRMPAYAIPSIAFPVMFYMLFGVMFGRQSVGGTSMATYLIATYGAFGVIGAALFGFGAGVATERGQGWMTLKRATPMPPFAFFTAKLAMCLLFAAAIVIALSVVGVVVGGVRLPPATWAILFVILVAGAAPFCAIGLALGYLTGPNSAPPIVNLVYLPMAFLSGLWIPIDVLPPAIKAIAPFLPAYHLGQLALAAIGASQRAPIWTHIVVLAGFTIVSLGVAAVGYRHDDDRSFG
ncbi:MAG TPA: ABC transporter permease [Vicinamibacterales bacterium]|jgi:ABC-2 type transport system permease protein